MMMRKRNLFMYGWAIMLSLATACREDGVKDPADDALFTYSFENGMEAWTGGFADYPVGEDQFYETSYQWTSLPAPLDQTQKALEISGNNHSDDLFMFIKREISGLQPNTNYLLTFDIELASNAPESSVGIGGSPGSSVYLKAGATQTEPKAIQEDQDWVMNIDKGNQSQEGKDMMLLGHIGTEKEVDEYTLITRSNAGTPFSITSDEKGSVWVIIGTDSGFEGTTTLYYKQIKLEFIAE